MKSAPDNLSPQSCIASRELLGVSQAELARLAGVSVSSVRRFERGETRVGNYVLGRVAAAFRSEGIVFIGPRPKGD